MSGADAAAVIGAMRSGDWLRTQWIARAAFQLGTTPRRPDYAMRVCGVLRRLELAGRVEQRVVVVGRVGELADTPISFAIPRTEWKIIDQDGGE